MGDWSENPNPGVWFTSDLHLGHANVIKYCKRPFKDADEMDETLVRNWNSVVRPGDRVYVLGDLCFHKPEKAKQTIGRLMGNIYLIAGNHDRDGMLKACGDRFIWIKDYFELKHEGQKVILSHYPFLTWNGCHRGTWHLHGHCHGSLPEDVSRYARRLDVGVDCHDFMPVSFEDVKGILEKKEFRPIDHHGRDDD